MTAAYQVLAQAGIGWLPLGYVIVATAVSVREMHRHPNG